MIAFLQHRLLPLLHPAALISVPGIRNNEHAEDFALGNHATGAVVDPKAVKNPGKRW